MPTFRYTAMDNRGRRRRGRLSAQSFEALDRMLQRQGLDLISGKPTRLSFLYHRTVSRRDLINFCFQLQQLIAAGVPLSEALADVKDTVETPCLREITSTIIDRIAEGQTFSGALGGFPGVFDGVFVNLVRVGEQSGQLPVVLQDLTETLKWQDELSARALKVFLYPAFVAIVVTGAVSFLMIFLVPQLVKFVAAMEGAVPVHTRALLWVSRLFNDYWWLIFGVPPLAIAGLAAFAHRNRRVRLALDALRLRIWVVGDILRKLALARLARMFALMYRSGMPILDILAIARHLVANTAIANAVESARDQIAQGESLTQAFANTALFPPLVLRMIKVGETTGDLESAMGNVGYFYDRDVKEHIDRLETMLEPAMTLVLGGILAWIMLAVLGPVYDLVSGIKP